MCAKRYENPKMLSKVTAKNVVDVFLRHTVYFSSQRDFAIFYITISIFLYNFFNHHNILA